MRLYLAGGFAEAALVSRYMREVEALGHEITMDWTESEGGAPGVTSDAQLSDETALRFARADLKGVRDADLVWHLVASYKGSRGAYVETGYALALNKPLIVSGPDWRKTIFHHLAMGKFEAHAEALVWLASMRGQIPSGSAAAE